MSQIPTLDPSAFFAPGVQSMVNTANQREQRRNAAQIAGMQTEAQNRRTASQEKLSQQQMAQQQDQSVREESLARDEMEQRERMAEQELVAREQQEQARYENQRKLNEQAAELQARAEEQRLRREAELERVRLQGRLNYLEGKFGDSEQMRVQMGQHADAIKHGNIALTMLTGEVVEAYTGAEKRAIELAREQYKRQMEPIQKMYERGEADGPAILNKLVAKMEKAGLGDQGRVFSWAEGTDVAAEVLSGGIAQGASPLSFFIEPLKAAGIGPLPGGAHATTRQVLRESGFNDSEIEDLFRTAGTKGKSEIRQMILQRQARTLLRDAITESTKEMVSQLKRVGKDTDAQQVLEGQPKLLAEVEFLMDALERGDIAEIKKEAIRLHRDGKLSENTVAFVAGAVKAINNSLGPDLDLGSEEGAVKSIIGALDLDLDALRAVAGIASFDPDLKTVEELADRLERETRQTMYQRSLAGDVEDFLRTTGLTEEAFQLPGGRSFEQTFVQDPDLLKNILSQAGATGNLFSSMERRMDELSRAIQDRGEIEELRGELDALSGIL